MKKPSPKLLDVAVLAHIDLIKASCDDLCNRLRELEEIYRAGTFGIERAFVTEVGQRMKKLRRPIAIRVSACEKIGA